jgi:hypothetical protein
MEVDETYSAAKYSSVRTHKYVFERRRGALISLAATAARSGHRRCSGMTDGFVVVPDSVAVRWAATGGGPEAVVERAFAYSMRGACPALKGRRATPTPEPPPTFVSGEIVSSQPRCRKQDVPALTQWHELFF